tara:strand:+ start:19638 stop:22067 length:2430 start_codon:yes stop_codon:yes gene_type:complete
MLITLNWLSEFLELEKSDNHFAVQLAEELLLSGLETEVPEVKELDCANLVIAEIISVQDHPNADRLSLCIVNDGSNERQIICGAKNVAPGQKIIVANPGFVFPDGQKIKKAKIRGVSSDGMICSEKELGIGEDQSGIMVLTKDAQLGISPKEVLGYGDPILDISITPNRSDCLSVLGVARESSAILGKKLKIPKVRVEDEPINVNKTIEIVNVKDCPRYTARTVFNTKIGESPDWLKARLRSSGMRPINNVVDITNYVMLTLGQPLHAFDMDNLKGDKILIRRWKQSDGPFLALDGKKYDLSDEDLMICDTEGPIALAGVIGGIQSEVTKETKNILFESAHFSPSCIRKTRRKIGLNTEASYRFERGVDPNGTILAVNMAVELARQFTEGKISETVLDIYPVPFNPVVISLRIDRIKKLLGISFTLEEIKRLLEPLSISCSEIKESVIDCEVPTFRSDITREIDLIEEIARRKGYNTFVSSLPRTSKPPNPTSKRRSIETGLRDAMIHSGFDEAINYSFVNSSNLELLGADPNKIVPLKNPLSNEMSSLRTTLLSGLLQNVSLNLNHGQRSIRLFEIGKTFVRDVKLPKEFLEINAVLIDADDLELWDDGTSPGGDSPLPKDIFTLKGSIERALEFLNFSSLKFENVVPDSSNPYETGSYARIILNKEEIGEIGYIKRECLQNYGIDYKLCSFEINLDLLAKEDFSLKRMEQLNRYPASYRDLAIVLDEKIPNSSIEMEISRAAGDILKSIKLFDIYQGANIENIDEKSVAYSLVFNNPSRTLTDEEVNEAFDSIVSNLGSKYGARLRS